LTPDDLRVIICLFFLLIWRKGVEMTQVTSGVHLPLLSKTETSQDLGKEPCFLPPTNLETRSAPASLTIFRKHQDKRGSIEGVFERLALINIPGKEYVKRYLQDMNRRNCKQKSLLEALNSLKLFLTFLRNTGKTELEEVTRADLEAFIEHEQDLGLKPSSVRTYLGRINTFLHFLVEEGILHPDVLARKIRLKLPQYLPKAIDPDDLRQLLSEIRDIRDRAIILVLLRSGMRIGELLDTKVNEVNIKERRITIPEGAKNRRGRVVYLSDDAYNALKAWLKKRDSKKPYLFYAQGKAKLTYSGANWMFRKYLLKAGLAEKGYTLHCLRHTFASELLNAGMRLECLQQLLGHDSIEVTRRYARLTDKTREEEYFRAMEIIERGEIDGHYRLDSELQTILKEKELLASYR